MAQDEYMDEKIDNYLNHRLPDEERKAFEEEIKANPSLKQEVELQKLLKGAVVEWRRQELKDYIREKAINPARQNNSGPMWMSIAAALILAIGAGLFVYLKQQHSAENKEMVYKAAPHQNTDSLSSAANTGPGATANLAYKNDSLAVNKPAPEKHKNEIAYSGNNSNPVTDKTIQAESAKVEKPALAPQEPVVRKYSDKGLAEKEEIARAPVSRDYSSNSTQSTLITLPLKKSGRSWLKAKKEQDTIASETTVKDTILTVNEISSSDEVNPLRKKVAKWKPVTIKVSLKKSPLNFSGYKYHHKVLTVYGLDDASSLALYSYKNNMYLRINDNVYVVKDDNYSYDLSEPVQDADLLRALGIVPER